MKLIEIFANQLRAKLSIIEKNGFQIELQIDKKDFVG